MTRDSFLILTESDFFYIINVERGRELIVERNLRAGFHLEHEQS